MNDKILILEFSIQLMNDKILILEFSSEFLNWKDTIKLITLNKEIRNLIRLHTSFN